MRGVFPVFMREAYVVVPAWTIVDIFGGGEEVPQQSFALPKDRECKFTKG